MIILYVFQVYIDLISVVIFQSYNALDSLFIIGNDILHQLTAYHNQRLKIVMSDFDGITKHADYNTFYVGDKVSDYRLVIGGYSGDAGLFIFKVTSIGQHTGF